MYGIIGEDRSDVATLKVLIKRILDDESVSIHGKGYDGCAQMLRKGPAQIALFSRPPLNYRRFIICYDADGANPQDRYKEALGRVVQHCNVDGRYCIAVPVQELEAWILADIQAVEHVFKGWVPAEITNPESVPNPKEHLEKLSRDSNRRPRYSHATHNEIVARHVDISRIEKKCRSFHPFLKFVKTGEPNVLLRPEGL